MKTKWVVEYWDYDADISKKVGFHSYEDAVTHKHKIMSKWNSSNIRISLRGTK